ncbi:MAG: DUF2442 domain-containing protein [Sphingomonas sp.]|nr:DUF2442 domain-containing protein [Sphingomonas sp.]
MAEPRGEDWDAAEQRGRIAMLTEPRALSAHYDAAIDRVVVELVNGCTFMFPPRLAQGLEHATKEELATVETSPFGFGLHWEQLNADFTVAGLMAGRFGTARYMADRFGPAWNAVAAE